MTDEEYSPETPMDDNPYAAPAAVEDDEPPSVVPRSSRIIAFGVVAGGITGMVVTLTLLTFPGPPSRLRVALLWGLVVLAAAVACGVTWNRIRQISRNSD